MAESLEPSEAPEDQHLRDYRRHARTIWIPNPIHDAIHNVVESADRGGARTSPNEMVSALIHHAITAMNDDELCLAWLNYRKATAVDLITPSPEAPQ